MNLDLRDLMKLFKSKKSHDLALTTFRPQINESEYVLCLREKISALEQEIKILTNGLFQAQSVAIKSTLFPRKGFLSSLQNRWYKSAASDSVKWHQGRLAELCASRNSLQIRLDKATGQFWKKRFLRWALLFCLFCFSAMFLYLAFLGMLIVINLLPLLFLLTILFFAATRFFPRFR